MTKRCSVLATVERETGMTYEDKKEFRLEQEDFYKKELVVRAPKDSYAGSDKLRRIYDHLKKDLKLVCKYLEYPVSTKNVEYNTHLKSFISKAGSIPQDDLSRAHINLLESRRFKALYELYHASDESTPVLQKAIRNFMPYIKDIFIDDYEKRLAVFLRINIKTLHKYARKT